MSQESVNKVLDLFRQKEFYPYGYMIDLEKFKKKLPSKKNIYSSLTDRKINNKENEHFLNA